MYEVTVVYGAGNGKFMWSGSKSCRQTVLAQRLREGVRDGRCPGARPQLVVSCLKTLSSISFPTVLLCFRIVDLEHSTPAPSEVGVSLDCGGAC